MKKRIVILSLLLMFTLSVTAFAATKPSRSMNLESPLDFLFTPPFAGCINVYNGDSYPNIAQPWFRVNSFLDENGYGTTASGYYQNTYLVLLDSDEWAKGNTTVATNALQTGTTLGTTKYFTYTSGYGPSSGKYVTISGYPVNYNFSTAYGVSFSWLV